MNQADHEPRSQAAPLGDLELAERFRDAIDASSPQFSPVLHANVMRGIRIERARAAAPPLSLHPWHIAALGAAAAAVAVTLAVAVALLIANREREKRIV